MLLFWPHPQICGEVQSRPHGCYQPQSMTDQAGTTTDPRCGLDGCSQLLTMDQKQMTERNWKDQIQKETENMTAANSVTTRAKGQEDIWKMFEEKGNGNKQEPT